MNKKLRIALCQMNPVVGDLTGNTEKIIESIGQAGDNGADLVVFPELVVTGYPPEDLLLRPQFIKDNISHVRKIAQFTSGITAIIGFADGEEKLYNAAAIIHDTEWRASYHKIHLPNYEVFDERRYFVPGKTLYVIDLNGVCVGVNICEDIWIPNSVSECQVFRGNADVIINISASPFHFGKTAQREKMLTERAGFNRAYILYDNLVGGQDELIFDGHSLVIDDEGQVVVRGAQFREDLILFDLDASAIEGSRKEDSAFLKNKSECRIDYPIERLVLSGGKKTQIVKPEIKRDRTTKLSSLEEIYSALTLGTRDYVRKNGFSSVVIGLSGGIDSALTAAIAVDALGADNVTGVSMPSQYSSAGSRTDAEALADNLCIKLYTIEIKDTYYSYQRMLEDVFQGTEEDVTEENIQARIRGNILMALSNKFGCLTLTTGNKSEISVGYCTLYGDMAGGFAVIKDVPKTLVYKLSYYVNKRDGAERIPVSTLTKAPSAELKPDQTDQDSLPPYNVLDSILYLYVEKDYDLKRITAKGFDAALVRRIIRMVDLSEYKRRQAAPGVKITPKAFGKDRRMPITNRYHR
ncbi:MAG: NAD+ synthase [candidate division KSB1 bacterium]|jgi:NAD+ synthase (glutamine-hydrolysing)|nr:NAD+ synthase [candidate division KSB1 bacterium]